MVADGNAEVYSWMFQALFGISCLILVSLPQLVPQQKRQESIVGMEKYLVFHHGMS